MDVLLFFLIVSVKTPYSDVFMRDIIWEHCHSGVSHWLSKASSCFQYLSIFSKQDSCIHCVPWIMFSISCHYVFFNDGNICATVIKPIHGFIFFSYIHSIIIYPIVMLWKGMESGADSCSCTRLWCKGQVMNQPEKKVPPAVGIPRRYKRLIQHHTTRSK